MRSSEGEGRHFFEMVVFWDVINSLAPVIPQEKDDAHCYDYDTDDQSYDYPYRAAPLTASSISCSCIFLAQLEEGERDLLKLILVNGQISSAVGNVCDLPSPIAP